MKFAATIQTFLQFQNSEKNSFRRNYLRKYGNCLLQFHVEVTVKKPVNQLYNYSTVLGAAIKCKPYSEITLEIGTHLKTVKITLNIFPVYSVSFSPKLSKNEYVTSM